MCELPTVLSSQFYLEHIRLVYSFFYAFNRIVNRDYFSGIDFILRSIYVPHETIYLRSIVLHLSSKPSNQYLKNAVWPRLFIP